MKLTNDIQITMNGFKHRTPQFWNWISIFLVGYATYQPAVMDWVHSAPFGSIEDKDLVMAWFDWLCPILGLLIQFTHKNYDNKAENVEDTKPATWD
jgi:hypothetical protein